MRKDIADWVRTCLACQRNKIFRHVKNTPDKIAIPDERFKYIWTLLAHYNLQKILNFNLLLLLTGLRGGWRPSLSTSTDTIISAFYYT